MNSEKLQNIPVPVLGSINGLLIGIFSEIVFRSVFLLAKNYSRPQTPSGGFHIQYSPYPLSWWFLPILLFITVTLATIIVHYSLTRFIKSPIWFWQIVGIVTMPIVLTIHIALNVFYNWDSIVSEFSELITAIKGDLPILLIIFLIMVVFNLLFAFVLKRFKTHLP